MVLTAPQSLKRASRTSEHCHHRRFHCRLVHQLVGLSIGAWCCPHDPCHHLACPAPANLREAETGGSVASFSTCAGNSGVRGTAAGLPPQFRDLSIAQAGSTWNITNNCSSDQGAEDDTPGYDSSAPLSLRKTARLDRGRTPRCASTPVTSSPQHGSSMCPCSSTGQAACLLRRISLWTGDTTPHATFT